MTLKDYLDIIQIILSIGLILGVVLQSKNAGLGGLTGVDTGGVFRARRGVEKILFQVTIFIAIAFFVVSIVNVMVSA